MTCTQLLARCSSKAIKVGFRHQLSLLINAEVGTVPPTPCRSTKQWSKNKKISQETAKFRFYLKQFKHYACAEVFTGMWPDCRLHQPPVIITGKEYSTCPTKTKEPEESFTNWIYFVIKYCVYITGYSTSTGNSEMWTSKCITETGQILLKHYNCIIKHNKA